MHDPTAQDVAEGVGIIWQSNVGVLGSGLSYRTPPHWSNHALCLNLGTLVLDGIHARYGACGKLDDLRGDFLLAQVSVAPNQLVELACHIGTGSDHRLH